MHAHTQSSSEVVVRWAPPLDGSGAQGMAQEGSLVLSLVGGDHPRRIFLQAGYFARACVLGRLPIRAHA